MSVIVERAALSDPAVVAIIAAHNAHCMAHSPPESCHTMAADALEEVNAILWVAHHDGVAAGVGALQPLPGDEGEIKSMHTLAEKRGYGIGAAILSAILTEARTRGYRRVSLETGTQEVFAAARALYERNGFVPCPPFGRYRVDPLSTYYTLPLAEPEGTR